MGAVMKLRMLANEIDWNVYDNGGIQYDLRKVADEMEVENEKLRKLADVVKEFVEDTHCEDCSCRRDCDDNNRIFCVNDFSYHAFAAMRKLIIEVDDGTD